MSGTSGSDVEQSGSFTRPGRASRSGLSDPAIGGSVLNQVEYDEVELAALEAVRGARIGGTLPLSSLDVT